MNRLRFTVFNKIDDKTVKIADKTLNIADKIANIADENLNIADKIAKIADKNLNIADKIKPISKFSAISSPTPQPQQIKWHQLYLPIHLVHSLFDLV